MNEFHLLKKDIAMNINKRMRYAFIMLVAGLFFLFILGAFNNPLSNFISNHIIIISLIYAALIVIVSIILLYFKAEKDPFTLMQITDMSITLVASTHEEELPIVGLALVEIEKTKYQPAVLLNFIYSESKQYSVMINNKELAELLAVFERYNINYE